jgi:hypothetical protein
MPTLKLHGTHGRSMVEWSGSLDEFMSANLDGLEPEQIAAVKALLPGDEMQIGGGAVPLFTLRRTE